jgi:hypothetical protein
MGQIKDTLFKTNPYLEKANFHMETRKKNYNRSFSFSIAVVFISALMHLISIIENDLIVIKQINTAYFISSSIICLLFIVFRLIKRDMCKYNRLLIVLVVFVNIAWGTSLLGFAPNRYEMYGTYALVLLVVASMVHINWYVHLLINIGSLLYLFSIYIFAPDINFFQEYLIPKITVLINLNIFSIVIGRLLYYRNLQNFELKTELIRKNREIKFEIEQKTKELLEGKESQIHDIVLSMNVLLELYTPYTKGHCLNVAVLSKTIAERLDLSPLEIDEAYWSAVIHDIGKILVPIEILNKPSSLTKAEYNTVKQHPIWGYNSLKEAKSLQSISKYVLHHHEWWNGFGYPEGLKGDEIPLISQIISISDAYDAMTSDRPYRKSLGENKALEIIKQNKGKQFSPRVVECFLDIIENHKKE